MSARLTQERARRLRSLIIAFANASIVDSWKGGGDPDDIPQVEQDLKDAENRLEKYIKGLVDKQEVL